MRNNIVGFFFQETAINSSNVVCHNMQYQTKILSKSRKNEFGDKNNLKTVPNRVQIFFES